MKAFVPHNKLVLIEPIELQSVIASQHALYEEKGTVVSRAADCETRWEAGDIVYFDPWLCRKYQDSTGKDLWLVPEANIAGYESIEHPDEPIPKQ
jgi:hypothetical protein